MGDTPDKSVVTVKNRFSILDQEDVLDFNKRRKVGKNPQIKIPISTINPIKEDPKYLIISSDDPQKQLKTVSPFVIKKWINANCDAVEEISRLRDGNILVLTKNARQTQVLLKLKTVAGLCKVKVELHKTLNICKGVIYCKDWFMLSDDEIKKELEDQKVVKVENIKREKDGKRIASPLFIISFNAYNLPTQLDTGFYKVLVKPYIPNPMRCVKCKKFGHTKNFCESPILCAECAEIEHIPSPCLKPIKCVNCNSSEHNSLNKICPNFIERKKILQIKIEDKCSFALAKKKFLTSSKTKIYFEPNKTFASITSNSNQKLNISVDSQLKNISSQNLKNDGQSSLSQIPTSSKNISLTSHPKSNSTNIISKKEEKISPIDKSDQTSEPQTSKSSSLHINKETISHYLNTNRLSIIDKQKDNLTENHNQNTNYQNLTISNNEIKKINNQKNKDINRNFLSEIVTDSDEESINGMINMDET